MKLQLLIEQFDIVTDTKEGLEQLRKIILGLAIQGNLSTQKSSDSSTNKLLKEIKEKKDQLYREGKIRKPKEYGKVTSDEQNKIIPESWKWCRLNDISIIETGKRMKGGALDNGVISLGGEHLNPDGTIDYSIPRFISEEFYRQLNRGKLKKHDILIVKDGATTGKTAFVKNLPPSGKAAINEHIVIVRGLGKVDKNFLFRFIQSLSKEFAKKYSKGIIGGVKMKQLRAFPLPLPPIEEQKRIVQKIESFFHQIDELEQKVEQDNTIDDHLHVGVLNDLQSAETKEESQQKWQRLTANFEQIYRQPKHIDNLKQAILKEAVRGRLVPQNPDDEPAGKLLERIKKEKNRLYEEGEIRKPKNLPSIKDEEKPYKLPKGWAWYRLGDIGFFTGGGTPKKSEDSYWDGKIIWVSPKDMQHKFISDSELKISNKGIKNSSAKLIPPRSILIVARSGILQRSLPVSINLKECAVNQDIKVIIPYIKETSSYIQLLLKGFEYYILENLVKQGMTVQSLKYQEFEEALFPIPPLQEQKRILNKVQKLSTYLDNLKEKLRYSESIRLQLIEALEAEGVSVPEVQHA